MCHWMNNSLFTDPLFFAVDKIKRAFHFILFFSRFALVRVLFAPAAPSAYLMCHWMNNSLFTDPLFFAVDKIKRAFHFYFIFFSLRACSCPLCLGGPLALLNVSMDEQWPVHRPYIFAVDKIKHAFHCTFFFFFLASRLFALACKIRRENISGQARWGPQRGPSVENLTRMSFS